jgi:tRNA/rRNA methyltransferase
LADIPGARRPTSLSISRELAGYALADRIVTLPVNPAFASLNLAQAVVIVAYEWSKLAGGGHLPFAMPEKSAPAPQEQLYAFFASLARELEQVEFFRPPDKRDTMVINLRNIFSRMQPTQQDIQTLHGVIMAIAEGRKGPARGGVLDSHEAGALRRLLAGQGGQDGGPVRGLARLLRRNPTEARHALAGTGKRPPLRQPRLQAADAGRPAYLRLCVLPLRGRRSCAGA